MKFVFAEIALELYNAAHGRDSDDQIIVYSVGGMPVEDVAWGKVCYENALAMLEKYD